MGTKKAAGSVENKDKALPLQQGFTLIELMMVIAIVAILAAVAYPSYLDTIRKARRADALDALLTLQNLQEKWRANHTSYGDMDDMKDLGGSDTSVDSYYALAIANNTATTFTLTAAAKGSQLKDTNCKNITLTVSAGNPRGLKGGTSTDCWKN